jgi:hypothetical protein
MTLTRLHFEDKNDAHAFYRGLYSQQGARVYQNESYWTVEYFRELAVDPEPDSNKIKQYAYYP